MLFMFVYTGWLCVAPALFWRERQEVVFLFWLGKVSRRIWRSSRAAAEAQHFLNTDFVQTYKLNNSVLCGLLQQHKCRDFRLKLRVLSPSSFIGKSVKFLRFRLTKLTPLLPIITAAVPLRLPQTDSVPSWIILKVLKEVTPPSHCPFYSLLHSYKCLWPVDKI